MENHQHPKTSVHAIVIALAILNAVGMLVLYFKIDLLSTQITAMPRTTDVVFTPTPSKADNPPVILPGKTWISYTAANLKFAYPDNWIVAPYPDDFVQGQQNLRLTSSPGQLLAAHSSGGPGTPGVTYFEKGFEIEMRKLAAGQDFGKMAPTPYTHIQKVVEVCEEAGCPDAEYLYFGKENTYAIIVNYIDDKNVAHSIIDTFLASLHE